MKLFVSLAHPWLITMWHLLHSMLPSVDRDSAIGLATRYELDCPEIESRWERIFPHPVQTGPGAYPASCTMRTGSFPGVKRQGSVVNDSTPVKLRG